MERPDEAFLQEARSNLRALTDGLLAIEGRRDAETVAELFRTAHSLKGACRTAGLTGASELAHAVEDVLDALRRGDVEATGKLIDESLAAVDDLEATIEAAAAGTEPAVDPVATGADLRDALEAVRDRPGREESADAPSGAATSEPTPDADAPPEREEEALSDDVLAALDDASEFDDIDALVAEMDDADDEAPLDGWGVLDDEGPAGTTAGEQPADPEPGGTPDDPAAFFETVKEDVDEEQTDVDDLQQDIDAVEFGEFDDDDDVTIEELIDLEPAEEPPDGAGDRETAGEARGPDATARPGYDPAPDAPDAGGADDATPSPAGTAGGSTEEPAADRPIDDPATAEEPIDDPATAEEPIDDPATEEPTAADSTAEESDGAAGTGAADGVAGEAGRTGSPPDADAAADEAGADVPPGGVPGAGEPPDEPALPPADAGGEPEPEPGPAAAGDAGAEVPDPGSLPDLEPDAPVEGLDLDPDAVEEPAGADASTEPDVEMDVALDEEMVAFESRFEDALDPSAGEPGAEEVSDVFRASVTTIEESRLDAERFGAGGEDADAGASGRLPPMTVTVETAERLMTVAEELSLVRHRLEDAIGPDADDALEEEVATVERIVTEYRRTVTDVRLMALEAAVEDVPRTVRDVARSQGKEVALDVQDADVRLDRGVIDRLRDPLVHLARNAVDHGIEPPADRVAAGKPPEGRIELRAEQVRDRVVIELSDDGRGIDPDRVREAAVEREHLSREAARGLSDEETYDLLFEAGVSTAQEVTDVSGRGVGMDVVGRAVDALDGSVEVESEPGAGTTVRLTVPVSVALTEVLFVEVGDERFGVPLSAVEGVTDGPDVLDGRTAVRHEELSVTAPPEGIDPGAEVPLVRLRDALGVDGPSGSGSKLVWVRPGGGPLAVGCDRIVGSREVVIRPYDDLLRDVPGVQGATTLADGRPVNVVDVESLA